MFTKKYLAALLALMCVGKVVCPVFASNIMNWVLKYKKPEADLLYECGFYVGRDMQAESYNFNKAATGKKLTVLGSDVILEDDDINALYTMIHLIAQGDKCEPYVKDVDGRRYVFDAQCTDDSRLYFIVTKSTLPDHCPKTPTTRRFYQYNGRTEEKVFELKEHEILDEKFFCAFKETQPEVEIIVKLDGHEVELTKKIQAHLLKMKNGKEFRPLVIEKTEATFASLLPFIGKKFCRYRFVISYDKDKKQFVASSCYAYLTDGEVGQKMRILNETQDVSAKAEEAELRQNDDPISASGLAARAATAAETIASGAAHAAERGSVAVAAAATAARDAAASAASEAYKETQKKFAELTAPASEPETPSP